MLFEKRFTAPCFVITQTDDLIKHIGKYVEACSIGSIAYDVITHTSLSTQMLVSTASPCGGCQFRTTAVFTLNCI